MTDEINLQYVRSLIKENIKYTSKRKAGKISIDYQVKGRDSNSKVNDKINSNSISISMSIVMLI